MFTVKVKKLKFHRNGVAGQHFYACLVDWKEGKEKQKDFLVTFTTKEKDDSSIVIESCRVINPLNISECYRGDNFAYALQELFDSFGKDSIYDLTDIFK